MNSPTISLSEHIQSRKNRRFMIEQAMALLGVKDSDKYDTYDEALSNYVLSSMNLNDIVSGSSKVWLDVQAYGEEDDSDNATKISVRTTNLWLSNSGYNYVAKHISEERIRWLLIFMDYWEPALGEEHIEHPKSSIDSITPNLLEWGTYLLIRGPVPNDFPFEGFYWYAIQRYYEISDLAKLHVNRDEYLKATLQRIHSKAQRELDYLTGVRSKRVITPEQSINYRAQKYIKAGISVEEALKKAYNEVNCDAVS